MEERLTLRGRLLLGTNLVPGRVVIGQGRILQVDRTDGSDEEPIIAPGFIDLQVNGGFGVEVADDPEALAFLAERLPETGVTAFLPTIITSAAAHYERVFASFCYPASGARVLGLHLEGPFLSAERAGAHPPALIRAADPALLEQFLAFPHLRLLTLAPERPEVATWIERFRKRNVVVSLGHTNATAAAFEAGVDAGAAMATHLFNAMSPFEHRAPGVIGAALLDDRIAVGLIADGVHSDPRSLELARRAKGWERIALVTDMVQAAGMPPGQYFLGGETVIHDGVSIRRPSGTLAGAALTMDAAVRNMVRWTLASLTEVLHMASSVPARLLRMEMGSILPGYPADLVLLDRRLQVQATLVGGQYMYRKEQA